jgi:ABC-type Zn2+ transport system substrate-binding protein/surface adhesin
MPEQAEYFTRNTDDFRVEIEMVFADFATKIQGKTAQEFIVFHDAYNYLMESVGIESSLKIPFSKNVLHETGTSHMKDLINEVELH